MPYRGCRGHCTPREILQVLQIKTLQMLQAVRLARATRSRICWRARLVVLAVGHRWAFRALRLGGKGMRDGKPA
eukprot:1375881-Prymnesium_polylepis.1